MHNSRTFKSKDWSWQSQARRPQIPVSSPTSWVGLHEACPLTQGTQPPTLSSVLPPMLDYRPSYSGQRNPVNPECPLSGRGGGRPGRTSVPARLPLTPPCMKHSKRSGQGSGRARPRLQVSTAVPQVRKAVSGSRGAHGGGGLWCPHHTSAHGTEGKHVGS